MIELIYTKIGGRSAFVFPDGETLTTPLNEGDRLKAIESPGGILLCKIDAETERQFEIARDVMRDNREALRRLAE